MEDRRIVVDATNRKAGDRLEGYERVGRCRGRSDKGKRYTGRMEGAMILDVESRGGMRCLRAMGGITERCMLDSDKW